MPQTDQDFYRTLQVHPEAEPEIITHVYRLLARKYHPDTAHELDKVSHEDIMKGINVAYETLSKPERRERYNATLPTSSGVNLDLHQYRFHLAAKLSEVGSSGGSTHLCYEESCKILEGIAAEHDTPTSAKLEALARLADTQFKGLQQYGKAAETYLRLLDMDPNADRHTKDALLWEIIDCYLHAKHYDQAVKMLERLISETSDPIRIERSEFLRASTHHLAHRHTTAITAYQEYARKYAGTASAAHCLFSAARIFDSSLEQWREAIAAYNCVLTEYRDSEPAKDCQWRIDLIQRKHIEKKGWWE